MKDREFRRPAFNLVMALAILGALFTPLTSAAEPATLNDYYDTAKDVVVVAPSVGLSEQARRVVAASVEKYATALRQFGPVEVVQDVAFEPALTAHKVRVILGTEHTNAVLRRHRNTLLARSDRTRVWLCGRDWPNRDLGSVFLNPLPDGLAIVWYLPDLAFLDRISRVFHGPTGFVVFNSVGFTGDPDSCLARGNFKKSGGTWTIDEETYTEMTPVEGLVVVTGTEGPTSIRRGDVVVSFGQTRIKASNLREVIEGLAPDSSFVATVQRDGKPCLLTLRPKELESLSFGSYPEAVPQLARAELQAEAARLGALFEESYIDPFELMKSSAFSQATRALAQLPPGDRVSLLDFYRNLARFSARLHDGHAYIDLGNLQSYLVTDLILNRRGVFPFQPLGGALKLWVPENSLGLPKGSELVRVNGRSASAVLQGLADLCSGDTLAHQVSTFAEESFSDLYLLAFGEEPRFVLELLTETGPITRTVAAVPLFERENRCRSNAVSPASDLLGSKAMLLRLDSFSGGEEYSRVIEQVFARLTKERLPNLVIDLRRNGGGSTDALRQLLSHLVADDYRVYKMTRVKRSKAAELRGCEFASDEPYGARRLYNVTSRFPGGKAVYRGRIFVLVGPKTFSTAFDCAVVLRERRQAVLVGEAPGGRMLQSGDHFQVQVLHGPMTISVPYKDFLPDVKDLGDHSSARASSVLQPDHHVAVTSRSLRQGTDPCIEFVEKLLAAESKSQGHCR